MVTCDSAFGGVFHARCLADLGDDYDGNEDGEWLCPACRIYLPDSGGREELEAIDEVPVSANTVAGIEAAIKAALNHVTFKQMSNGFQSRLQFLKAIIEAKGGNQYDRHWRKKDKE